MAVLNYESRESHPEHFKNFPTQAQLKFLSNLFFFFSDLYVTALKNWQRGGLVWGAGVEGKWGLHGNHFTQVHPRAAEDKHRSARKRPRLVLPCCAPSPKNPRPKLSQGFPCCPQSQPRPRPTHTVSLHLLVLAPSSLCSRHSELPVRHGSAAGNRPVLLSARNLLPGTGWTRGQLLHFLPVSVVQSSCQRHPATTSVLNCKPGLSHPSFTSPAFSLFTPSDVAPMWLLHFLKACLSH